jgi:hypothetical protein
MSRTKKNPNPRGRAMFPGKLGTLVLRDRRKRREKDRVRQDIERENYEAQEFPACSECGKPVQVYPESGRAAHIDAADAFDCADARGDREFEVIKAYDPEDCYGDGSGEPCRPMCPHDPRIP